MFYIRNDFLTNFTKSLEWLLINWQEDLDTEWKFTRTKLWLGWIYKKGVLPPPLNILYIFLPIRWVVERLFAKFGCGREASDGKVSNNITLPSKFSFNLQRSVNSCRLGIKNNRSHFLNSPLSNSILSHVHRDKTLTREAKSMPFFIKNFANFERLWSLKSRR